MRTEDDNEPVIEPAPERRPGADLARAREQAGIGLRAMADTLHLPEGQVRALENDDYARLPPPTFVRGYLRTYARVLGLDDDDIVAAYDALSASDEDPELHLAGGREGHAHNRGLALALVVLALAVGVSLGAWWWQLREGPAASADAGGVASGAAAEAPGEPAAGVSGLESAGLESGGVESGMASGAGSEAGTGASAAPAVASSSRVSAPASGAPADAAETTPAHADDSASASEDVALADATPSLEDVQSAPDDVQSARDEGANAAADSGQASTNTRAHQSPEDQTPEPTGGRAQVSAPTGDGASEPATAAATTAPYDPPAVTASAEAAIAPQAAEGPELLSVRVDGRTWVEVYDARGRELVYTLYTGSAPLQVRGWPPFDVFLGNSPAVAIEFNGDAVEKTAFTRSDRTARFLVDADGARRR